ncbi:Gfo/Idh/MocA family protein [Halalkalibacter kiskunsagensis]|uniref:Gfo/Idh/MocA family protein n=1 Tax=Halalkalibacter kiskunsagensis TaxID=1548599 RepID=A0ABV6KFK3_9BACI
MINVALLSKWHVHAEDYARQAQNNPHLALKLVWDEYGKRGREWAEKLGIPFESDLKTVLASSEIDAVIVDTPTNMHKEVIIAAAENKKHIFTEKVLALSVEDCKAIISAVKENQVQLTVSLPRLTEDYYLYAQDVLDQGMLGTLTTIRCRLAHNGAVVSKEHPNGWLPDHFFNQEKCGGGAFIDLGAHPIYLTNRLAGKVCAVTARLKKIENHEVDTNSVALIEYESGALGILETGFLSSGSPFQLELYGTEGTLLIEERHIRMKSKQLGEGWKVPEELPASNLLPLDQWVDAIVSGATTTINDEDALNLTLVNEMAELSNRKGQRVEAAEVLNVGWAKETITPDL